MYLFNAFQKAGLRGQNGFALIVVLGILLLLTGLAFVSFSTSDTDRQIASNNLNNARSYYAAEAGIIRATSMLVDSNWRAGFSDQSIGNATYDVRVIDSFTISALKDSLILRSVGYDKGAQSQIDVLMSPAKPRQFKWAAFGDTAAKVTGGAFIDSYNSDSGTYISQAIYGPDACGNMYAGPAGGNVGGNNIIDVSGNGCLHGDVSTPDTVVEGTTTIYGTVSSSGLTTSLPPITTAEMNNAKATSNAPAGLILTGSASYDSTTKALSGTGGTVTLSSGTYYFSSISMKSDIIIAPGAKVIIYTDGNIDARGSVVNSSLKPENFQIYSTGSTVSLNSGTTVYACLYAPNASVTINGGSEAFGSFIGMDVKANGGARIHFDRSLLNMKRSKFKYAKVAWKVL